MKYKYTSVVKAMSGMQKRAWSWLDDVGMQIGDFLGGQDTALGRMVQPSLHNQAMHMYSQEMPQEAVQRRQQMAGQYDAQQKELDDQVSANLDAQKEGYGYASLMAPGREIMPGQQQNTSLAQTQPPAKPQLGEYQNFDKSNLSAYTQDQINAINAAAQKNGIAISDLRGVRFNDKGQVTGLRRVKQPTAQAAPPPTAQNPTALPPLQKGQGRIVQNGQVYTTPSKPAQQQRPPKGTIRATIGGTNYNMGANGNITRQ